MGTHYTRFRSGGSRFGADSSTAEQGERTGRSSPASLSYRLRTEGSYDVSTPLVERPEVSAPPTEARPIRRYATPTGDACPYTQRADGSVEGDGACRGCGTCLLGAGWES
jgi:hypothetical protein